MNCRVLPYSGLGGDDMVAGRSRATRAAWMAAMPLAKQ